MTDQELKNLSDSELIKIIDDANDTDAMALTEQIGQLVKTDGEFRARIHQLKAHNKNDIIESRQALIKSLEDNIKSADDNMKPHLQAFLDRLSQKNDLTTKI